MYTTDGILNVTNWCALAVAISVPGICSFDAVLERYYKGPEAKPKDKNKSRWDMVNEMYLAGIPWSDIALSLGYSSENAARSSYSHGKHNFGRRNLCSK